MPIIQITFDNGLPANIQIGDTAWYSPENGSAPVMMGPITDVDYDLNVISIDLIAGTTPPTLTDFVFFEKSPIVSIGSLKGYYANTQFRNDSTSKAELFSVGTEVFESSK
jgi:hypothetical protein